MIFAFHHISQVKPCHIQQCRQWNQGKPWTLHRESWIGILTSRNYLSQCHWLAVQHWFISAYLPRSSSFMDCRYHTWTLAQSQQTHLLILLQIKRSCWWWGFILLSDCSSHLEWQVSHRNKQITYTHTNLKLLQTLLQDLLPIRIWTQDMFLQLSQQFKLPFL